MDQTRRNFLQLAGSATAVSLLPGLIDRAMAIPANGATRSIRDVEHIVVFMQENRSFDHYFGAYNGVRGFGDPRPTRLAGGRSVWCQPSDEHPDGYVVPFHGDSKLTRSFLVDGSGQSHQTNVGIFNRGRFDKWGETRELHKRMLHYTAGDLPFYYALADAFTICDAYHCSTMTQTYPNRLHLFTGCNGGGTVGGDPEMSNYGEDETPSADMADDKALRADAYRWTTYAERLEKAGVSWKVYQEFDNFGDNLLSVFPAFRPCAKESPLYRKGRSWVSEHAAGDDRKRSDGEQLVAAFRRDLETGALPQVSWIVTAAALSEHPDAEPSRGEHVCARLIEALVDNPTMFAKTAFIINYDEPGGFYDHVPPPVPPVAGYQGFSTVSLDGETKDYGQDGKPNPGAHPIGLGARTPTIIVSPWSRGGFVCSELFDHTSVIRFMEARFGAGEPNISAWRRSVCGDLTSAFDFSGTPQAGGLALPKTDDFIDRIARSKAGSATAIPAEQAPAVQMAGQRPLRASPYAIDAFAVIAPTGKVRLDMANRGRTGVALAVHDNRDVQAPWHFTIGAGDRHVSDLWFADAPPGDGYDLTLVGPDGYFRRFAGSFGAAAPKADATLMERRADGAVEISLVNQGDTPMTFEIALDQAYHATGDRSHRRTVAAGQMGREVFPLGDSGRWYDLSVRLVGADTFLRRFAGRVENGRPTQTDPAIGAMRMEV